MDPDNYDNYGGVEHAEYCFQVNFDNLINDCLSLVTQMSFIESNFLYQNKTLSV